jgi:hypothetical protein
MRSIAALAFLAVSSALLAQSHPRPTQTPQLSPTGPSGGAAGVSGFNARTGAVTLTSEDVTTALTYTPAQSVHAHTQGDVTGLTTSLSGKAATIHAHAIADTTSLQSALDSKQAAGSYANATHAHSAATDLTGTLAAARMPALTGDVTSTVGTVATTLATVNSNVGTFGGSTAIPVITVNAKGLVTAVTTATPSGGGGGADPWTRTVLSSDFSNTAVTFSTITGFSWNPTANTNFTIECELLLTTGATASLPRIGVSIGAGQAYGAVEMTYQSAAAAQVVTQGQFNTAAVNIQMPVGSAPIATNPYYSWVMIKGRAGASPTTIAVQLAAETAATATAVKQGSECRIRTA